MNARVALVVVTLSMAAAVASPHRAHAQSSEGAATLEFDRGRQLMKQKKYEEACAAFAKSQKLDAQNGTLYNLADCQVHVGKLASAWLAYKDLAQRDTNAARKSESQHRANELEPRLPKLLVKLPASIKGATLTIDGKDSTSLAGIAAPVDLGDYQVHATAPGRETFDKTVTVADEGKTVSITVQMPKSETAGGGDTAAGGGGATGGNPSGDAGGAGGAASGGAIGATGEPARSHRKRDGVITMVVGGAALVAGGVFGLEARSNNNDAQTLCPSSTCASPGDKQRGDDLISSARTDATLSTGFVIGGAVIAVVGVYMIATAKPERATAAMIAPLPSGGAVVGFGGRF
nr:hypothetical protein [Kofleriaceae bacterium]